MSYKKVVKQNVPRGRWAFRPRDGLGLNESLTVYLLVANGSKIDTETYKNFAFIPDLVPLVSDVFVFLRTCCAFYIFYGYVVDW